MLVGAVVTRLLIAGGAALLAQQQPTFRSGVELLPIDVVVVDAGGRPVPGLTKADFTVLADGEPMPVQTIAEVRYAPVPGRGWPTGIPRDVADNRDAASERLVMIVLDDMFVEVDETVKAAARRLISGIGGTFSIGLVTTSGRPGVEITQDPNVILDFIARFEDAHPPERGPETAYTSFGRMHATKTVQDVARMVGANDGREKVFVWIRGDRPDTTDQKSISMMEHLRRSGVTTYLVPPSGRITRLPDIAFIDEQRGLREPRAPALDMHTLLEELNNHYILGVVPDTSGDRDRYRRFTISVNRPDVTVRHRRGYDARGPAPPPENRTEQGRLVAEVLPKTALPLRLHAVPFFTPGKRLQVAVTLEVDLGAFPEPDANGEITEEVYYEVFAASMKERKIATSVAGQLDIRWPVGPDGPEGLPRFRVRNVLELDPGPYQLRAAAIPARTERSGSVYLHIEVPESTGANLSLSGLAMAPDGPEPDLPRLIDVKPLAMMTLPFRPSLDRTFAPGDTLRVFFQVRRWSAATPVVGTLDLVASDGAVARSVPWQVAPVGDYSVDLGVPLAGLPPGGYRVIVTATDGEHEATSRAGISIGR